MRFISFYLKRYGWSRLQWIQIPLIGGMGYIPKRSTDPWSPAFQGALVRTIEGSFFILLPQWLQGNPFRACPRGRISLQNTSQYLILISFCIFPWTDGATEGVLLMKCRNCGAVNRKDSKFCKQCGSSLKMNLACPRCHFENLPDASFCTDCGTRLSIQGKPRGTQKRCQSCGYPNDIDAVYCYCCNQKILEDYPE